ncbi:MAG: MATE family efflux transporter [Marinilabiliales bacterium]|nr:MAG: MATE family efflux transporter [Marinilabiliales bacterium]
MKDLTTGKEGKLILRFAIPLFIGNIFQQLYNIVDSLVVGNFLGKDALAAVGASFPVIFALISLIIGVATGATIIIAQYFGAKEYEKVKRAIDTMYIFMFIAALIVSVAGIYFTEDIFRLLQLPEEIMPMARDYLRVYMAGMIVFFGFNGTSAILRGLGDSKTPLYFLIISSVVNIILDLLFILVFGWGVAAVAWATIIAQGGAFVTAIIYLNRTHLIMKFSFTGWVFDRNIFYNSIRIGVPSGLQHTFVALGMMALMGIVNTFGTDVIAAYSVAQRIDSLAAMVAMNFGMAVTSFTGQNIGANRYDRVKRGFMSTLSIGSLITVMVTILVLLWGKQIMGFFTPDQEVVNYGTTYLNIVSPFYITFTVMFIVGGVMRGAGDTLVPMFLTLFSLWVIRIPLAFILSPAMGETGIWWAIPIGWISGTILSYGYYLTGRWKTRKVTGYGRGGINPSEDTAETVADEQV